MGCTSPLAKANKEETPKKKMVDTHIEKLAIMYLLFSAFSAVVIL